MEKFIIFLDYDGVVNTPYWTKNEDEVKCLVNLPSDGFVNNFQAICWLNELYNNFQFDIIVTSSTWRFEPNYKEALYNGGLNKNIKIIGKTPFINYDKEKEIKAWLVEKNYNGFYIIIDDDYIKKMEAHLIKCNSLLGFTINEFNACKLLLKKLS